MNRITPCLLAVLLSTSVCRAEPIKYTFKLDDKPFTPRVISLTGHPETPAPGDLIFVDDYWLVLDDNPSWALVNTSRDDGVLYRTRGKNREIVAARIRTTYKGEKEELINPLAVMTGEEKAALRGITLDAWEDKIAKSLADLSWAATALKISDSILRKGSDAFPELSDKLRYLDIDEHSNCGFRDYKNLAHLKSLVVLKASTMTVQLPIDCIAGMTKLRYLQIYDVDPKEVDAIGKLVELRTLRLSHSRQLKQIDFASKLTELVDLDLRGSTVKDLLSLNELPHLERIQCDGAPIAELPKHLPELKYLNAFSTKLTDEQTAAFHKANPKCKIRHRWEQVLRDSLEKADRIRIRSGGTCHRRVETEKTLTEVKGEKAIQEFVAAINIDEGESSSECMCCGNPSLEFYLGDELILTLGFHHGQTLRWVGVWPADASLAPGSAEKLCKWMADHGVDGPKREYEANAKRKAAARLKMKLIEASIPKDVLEKLKAADGNKAVIDAFEKGIPDATKRVDVYFRMIGCAEADWSLSSGADELVTTALLSRAEVANVSAAAKEAKDPESLSGAGRWLFAEKKWKDLPKKNLDEIVRPVAEFTLGHPRMSNRRRTMGELKEMATPGAKELLHRVFEGKIEIRVLSKEYEDEPGGSFTARPDDLDLQSGSDAAQAARLLAELSEKNILADVEKRIKTAKNKDKEIYEKILEKLSK